MIKIRKTNPKELKRGNPKKRATAAPPRNTNARAHTQKKKHRRRTKSLHKGGDNRSNFKAYRKQKSVTKKRRRG
jgi:hypothetical protein